MELSPNNSFGSLADQSQEQNLQNTMADEKNSCFTQTIQLLHKRLLEVQELNDKQALKLINLEKATLKQEKAMSSEMEDTYRLCRMELDSHETMIRAIIANHLEKMEFCYGSATSQIKRLRERLRSEINESRLGLEQKMGQSLNNLKNTLMFDAIDPRFNSIEQSLEYDIQGFKKVQDALLSKDEVLSQRIEMIAQDLEDITENLNFDHQRIDIVELDLKHILQGIYPDIHTTEKIAICERAKQRQNLETNHPAEEANYSAIDQGRIAATGSAILHGNRCEVSSRIQSQFEHINTVVQKLQNQFEEFQSIVQPLIQSDRALPVECQKISRNDT